MLSPDMFASQSIDDLTADGYDALRTVWPAAWEAVSEVFALEDGLGIQLTALTSISLFDLVAAHQLSSELEI